MRLTLIILSVLAVGLPTLAIDLLPDDATFSKTVTMDFKGESLSDIAKVLSKATGVRVRASEDVADQKVTILVDNMSIKDVMNGIATLFGWSWAVRNDDDGKAYIIYDPLRKKGEANRKEALDKARDALGKKLDSLAYNAERAESFYETLALLQYRSLSPKLRNALLSGMHVCFSLESSMPAWRPSQVVMDAFANSKSRIGGLIFEAYKRNKIGWEPDPQNPHRINIELSSDISEDTITVRSKVLISYYHPDPNKSEGILSISIGDAGKVDLCEQEIDYPPDIKNTLPDKPADELLGKKVSISPAELVAEGAMVDDATGDCFATRTDLLSVLHNMLGLQVISDYYSSWGYCQDIQDTTVTQLLEEQFPDFPADWGWDGRVLYMREKDIRTADSREIPNRLLRRWQAVVKRQGYRSLEELAQAAAFLSDEQRQAISEDCRYLKLGECKEVDYIIGGGEYAMLRFYGLLTSKQKKDIFTGGVGAMQLTPEQRSALAALLYPRALNHAGVYNKDGLNMDEPQVVRGVPSHRGALDLSALVVKVQMTCSSNFVYIKPEDDFESLCLRNYPAVIPEEALDHARRLIGEDANPENVVAVNDYIYTLAVRYEGYEETMDAPVSDSVGWIRITEHSTYHRLKIKVPDKKNPSAQ